MSVENTEPLSRLALHLEKSSIPLRRLFIIKDCVALGLHTIDSRSEAWYALKACVDNHCSTGYMALLARPRIHSMCPGRCRSCIESIDSLIHDTLDRTFGPWKTDCMNKFFPKYEPAAKVLSCVSALLTCKDNAELLCNKCPHGHIFVEGDYITTIEFEFEDTAFKVDYYMTSYGNENKPNILFHRSQLYMSHVSASVCILFPHRPVNHIQYQNEHTFYL